VVDKVKALLPSSGLDETNIIVSSIHNHSGPGGDSWRLLYNFTILGFDKDGLGVVVDGIVSAITLAEQNIKPNCKIYINEGHLPGAQINRSPEA